MATIIEFFVPSSFRKKATKPEEYGKVIPFRVPQKSQLDAANWSTTGVYKSRYRSQLGTKSQMIAAEVLAKPWMWGTTAHPGVHAAGVRSL
jgi:hypothetical protein